MWILHFIPDSLMQLVTLCIIGGGLGLYAVGFLMNFLTGLRPYKESIRIAATALCVIGVYFYSGYSVEMEWRARVEQLQAQLALAEAKSQQVITEVRDRIVYKTRVIHDRQVVVQEKIIHDAAVIDAECKVPKVAIDDLNGAAKDPNSDPKEGDKR